MIKRLASLLVILPLLLSAEPSVSVTVDKNPVTLNTVFNLTVEFTDFKDFPSFNPDLKGNFSIISGPSRGTNYSWINGVGTYTKSLTWSIAPLRTGDLEIPAFEFRDRQKTYRSAPVVVTVNDPADRRPNRTQNSDSSPDPIFIKAEISSRTAVPGEVINLQYRLYFRQKVINYSFSPLQSMPGFLVENIQMRNQPSTSTEIINGIEYSTAVLRSILLVPTESGSFTVPPQRVRLEIQRSVSRRSIFDDPFFGNLNTQNVDLLTDPVQLTVHDLPPGAPASFLGAVGEFSLSASIDTVSLEADQACNLLAEVRGKGNLKNFSFLQPEFPESFQVFDPKMDEKVDIRNGSYSGLKKWEFIFIPSAPGTYEIPDAEFTYYSPTEKKYKTLRAAFPDIEVRPNERLVEDMRKGLTQQEVSLLNQDIRYIFSTETSTAAAEIRIDYWKVSFPALLGAILLILHYLTAFAMSIRNNDPVRVRRRNAFSRAEKSIRHSGGKLEFISSAFKNYFADILNLQDGEVSAETVRIKLRGRRLKDDTVKEILELFHDLDKRKFSPGEADTYSEEEKTRLMKLLARIEGEL